MRLTERFRGAAWSAAMLAALLLQACGGGDDGGGTPPPPPPPDTTAPTAPQNLAATASGPTQVALTWSASTDSGGAGLAGYRVLRGGTEIATTAATSYTDSGLAASTAYSYTVRAYDGATPANVSADSAPVNITTPATAVVGLDARPSNTTCLAGMPPRTDGARLDRVFTNLSFSSPILALQAPGNPSRWFVVQQGGRVLVFPNTATPVTNTFIDITSRVASGGELGLLGMAFHPNFPTDPRVFLSYTAGNGGSRVSRISSFRTTDGGLTLDTASEKIWLTLNQPEDNHNGGNINFGPDGFLYIGFGDGGGGGDAHTQNGPIGNGQSLTTMLGKMLRIDVGAETAPAYVIPSTNPFAPNPKCGPTTNGLSCPEIYAYGLRNPWRWSFDRQSGELWVGDVGQGAYEEVDIVQRGGNYGWRCREGLHAYDMTGCPSSGFIDPVAEYTHADGQSITGGYVYRGTQATTLVGRYIFADYVSQRLWTLQPNTSGGFTVTNLLTAPFNVSSFAQAVDGELYVLDYGGGLYHLTFLAGAGGGTIPVSLAASGCVDASDPTQPASGLIPYTVNAPFWSDGAVKDRWIALPNGQNMAVAGDGDWTPPNGSILVKNFRLGTTLVETRLFMHHSDGSWAGYSYQWNDAQTDATLVSGGATKVWGAQTWIYLRSRLPAVPYRSCGARAWPRNGADESQFHLPDDRPHGKPGRDAQRHQYADAANRRGPLDVAGLARSCGRLGDGARTRTRLPARELRAVPPPGRPDAGHSRLSLYDAAQHDERMPCDAAGRRSGSGRRREDHYAGQCGEFGAGGARESARCRPDAAAREQPGGHGRRRASYAVDRRTRRLQLNTGTGSSAAVSWPCASRRSAPVQHRRSPGFPPR